MFELRVVAILQSLAGRDSSSAPDGLTSLAELARLADPHLVGTPNSGRLLRRVAEAADWLRQ